MKLPVAGSILSVGRAGGRRRLIKKKKKKVATEAQLILGVGWGWGEEEGMSGSEMALQNCLN